MRLIYFIIIFLIISCSKNKEKVDIDSFLNQGTKVTFFKNNNDIILKEIFEISKINKNTKKVSHNWSQSYFNSENQIPSGNDDLNKIRKKFNIKSLKIISFSNFIAGVDNKSNLFLIDKNFKLLKKIKIYKKRIIQDYALNFSLIYLNGHLITSDNLGNINAFDSKTLKKKWNVNLSSPFKGEIKSQKNNIYLINSNSKIYSIDAKNGNINWSFETSSKLVKDDKSYQMVITGNKLIFSNDHAEIYCIDLSKKDLIWSLSLSKNNFQKIPLIFKSSPFVVKNNTLFFSTNLGNIYSINVNNGEINWSNYISLTNRIYLYDNKLFITKNKNLIIINAENGKLLFNKKFDNFYNSSDNKFVYLKDIYIGNNFIYLFVNNNDLIKLSKNNLQNSQLLKSFLLIDYYIFFNGSFVAINKNSLNLF